MNTQKIIKVIVSMIGLDGHTTGAEVVARILRNAGIEVIYLGVNQTPEMIFKAAIQEDVDAIGISSHASNYSQIRDLVDMLRKENIHNMPVICGGNVPKHMIKKLKEYGVAEVFLPGSTGDEIVDYIISNSENIIARSA